MRICDECGVLLSYAAKDIYEKKYVYCINCKHKNEVPEIIDVEVKKDGNVKENTDTK